MFHLNLVKLRKEKELTQQQVADFLNISRTTYAHYEIGRREPDFNTLKKLAKFFNTTTDYLLGLTDNPSPPSTEPELDDITDAQIAANMEGRYGEKPSPELVAFIKKVINEELEKRKN